MSDMERGTISELALEGSKRGMSYGQYVAARYYPVTILEELPDGGKIVRSAALPPMVPGWEKARERMRRRVGDGACRSSKPQEGEARAAVRGVRGAAGAISAEILWRRLPGQGDGGPGAQ